MSTGQEAPGSKARRLSRIILHAPGAVVSTSTKQNAATATSSQREPDVDREAGS